MKYHFAGKLVLESKRQVRFEIVDGRIFLPASIEPAIASIKRGGILAGLIDEGQYVEILFEHLYQVGFSYGLQSGKSTISRPHIEGFVKACVVYNGPKPEPFDSICFFSSEISKVIGYQVSASFIREMAEIAGLEKRLGIYRKDGHEYILSIGFLRVDPTYRGQSLELKSDSNFTLNTAFDSYWVVKRLLTFLYQKRLVPLEGVYLKKEGKTVGQLFVEKPIPGQPSFLSPRCLSLLYLEDKVDALLQAVADGQLYLRHLPVFQEDESALTSGRFLMALVGLERVLSCFDSYGPTDTKNKAIQSAEQNLKQLAAASSGYEKRIYKGFVGQLKKHDSLARRIELALEDNTNKIANFFPLSSIGGDPAVIAQDLAEARNSFAHGDLDADLTIKNAQQMQLITLLILYLQLLLVGFDKTEASRIVPNLLF